MRKITAGLHITLDGVVEAPEKWAGPYFTGEMEQMMHDGIAQADAVLLGRRTYELFARYWPTKGDSTPMAAFLNHSPKHVVTSKWTSKWTSTPNQSENKFDKLEWENSVSVIGDLWTSIFSLKQRPGKNIQVPGSPTLVRWLIGRGLLDELALFVFPIVVGGGHKLFENMDLGTRLELVESRMFTSGALCVRYESQVL